MKFDITCCTLSAALISASALVVLAPARGEPLDTRLSNDLATEFVATALQGHRPAAYIAAAFSTLENFGATNGRRASNRDAAWTQRQTGG